MHAVRHEGPPNAEVVGKRNYLKVSNFAEDHRAGEVVLDPEGASDVSPPQLPPCVDSKPSDAGPSQAKVHLALLVGQAINGGAAVVAKTGLPAVNPLFFALLRETLATPIIALLARHLEGPVAVRPGELRVLALASLALFSNQIGYVTGLKLASPVMGAAWQPSQAVFVLIMAVALGQESCSTKKLLGVLCCLLGGATMTVGGAQGKLHSGNNEVVGNMLFFFNCFMTAVFVLTMRVAARSMPAYTALAVVYAMASVGIALFAKGASLFEGSLPFFCPDCEGFWDIPLGALFALAYWVLGTSVTAYMCLTYGAKHARDATHCLAYTAMQPVTAALVETALVSAGWNERHLENPLELPGPVQAGGALLVVCGVFFVAGDARGAAAPKASGATGRTSPKAEETSPEASPPSSAKARARNQR